MALWSAQSLTEMSSRNIPGAKGGRVKITTSPLYVSRLSRQYGIHNILQLNGLHGLLQG
jgi:hypothetical protein